MVGAVAVDITRAGTADGIEVGSKTSTPSLRPSGGGTRCSAAIVDATRPRNDVRFALFRTDMYLILSFIFLTVCGLFGAIVGDRLEAVSSVNYSDAALVGPVCIALGAGIVVCRVSAKRRDVTRALGTIEVE